MPRFVTNPPRTPQRIAEELHAAIGPLGATRLETYFSYEPAQGIFRTLIPTWLDSENVLLYVTEAQEAEDLVRELLVQQLDTYDPTSGTLTIDLNLRRVWIEDHQIRTWIPQMEAFDIRF